MTVGLGFYRKLLDIISCNASPNVVQKYLSGHLTIGPVLVRTVVCEYRTSSDINGMCRIVNRQDGHHARTYTMVCLIQNKCRLGAGQMSHPTGILLTLHSTIRKVLARSSLT